LGRLVIGCLVVGIGVVLLVKHVVRTEQHLRAREHAVRCQTNLRSIGHALHMYADRNGGAYPDTLDRLRAGADLPPSVYSCPATPDAATGAYLYAGDGLTLVDEAREDIVVAFERPGSHHHPDGVGILRTDGHVEYLVDYRSVLDQFAAGVRPIKTHTPSTRPH
jgi:hypothetical protein